MIGIGGEGFKVLIIHSRSAKTWGRMPRALDIKMWSHRYNPTGSRFKGAPGDKPFVVRGKVLKKNTRINHRKYRHACHHTIYEFDQYSGSFPSPSVVFLPEGKARWIAAEKQSYGFYHRWNTEILTSWGLSVLFLDSGMDV